MPWGQHPALVLCFPSSGNLLLSCLSVCLSHCPCCPARARLEAFSDHSGKLQVPLQEIIDWLGQKDEELSAQLPLRGDVLLVQQEKETHAVSSCCSSAPALPRVTAMPQPAPEGLHLCSEKRQSPAGFRQKTQITAWSHLQLVMDPVLCSGFPVSCLSLTSAFGILEPEKTGLGAALWLQEHFIIIPEAGVHPGRSESPAPKFTVFSFHSTAGGCWKIRVKILFSR